MRRFFYSLAALAGLVCGLTGCYHTAGVCDCDIEEDPCTRCPWFHGSSYHAPAPVTDVPQKLPSKL